MIIGPIRPVSRPGEINSKPYVATLAIRSLLNGQIVAAVTSAADGTFQVTVPAGQYLVEPKEGSPYPTARPQQVVVTQGKFTTITVEYDSGIR